MDLDTFLLLDDADELEDDDADIFLMDLCGLFDEPRSARTQFDLQSISPEKCRKLFRFEQDHLLRLKNALGVPDVIKCDNGTVAPGLEGLCILLRRLSYPNRLVDLSNLFDRSEFELSLIVNKVLDFVYNRHQNKLHDLSQRWIDPRAFAQILQDKGCPMDRIWGFIDGTVRPICRPGHFQQDVYNGHRRTHALKFQSIMTPCGLVADLFGPIEGRRHDAALCEQSGIYRRLDIPKFAQFSIYGDSAYPLRPQIIVPYRGAALTNQQRNFNQVMSPMREAVEWGFGQVATLFSFIDFKKNLKMFLQPVGKYYLVATLLANCHTCLYGNQVSQFFNTNPPDLEDYLS